MGLGSAGGLEHCRWARVLETPGLADGLTGGRPCSRGAAGCLPGEDLSPALLCTGGSSCVDCLGLRSSPLTPQWRCARILWLRSPGDPCIHFGFREAGEPLSSVLAELRLGDVRCGELVRKMAPCHGDLGLLGTTRAEYYLTLLKGVFASPTSP